jgi:NitT/TauT family transport system substrate-binding protein
MRVYSLVVLMAWVATAVGCTPGNRHSAPLRIGVNPWPGFLFLHHAADRGYFEDEGAHVELVELSSCRDVAVAYQLEQIDIATTTTIDLLFIRHLSERSPVAFLVTDESSGADVILARPGIESVADLPGHRVAAEPASLDLMLLALALESVGRSLSDVEVVSIAQAEMAEEYRAGEVDAAVAYPPGSLTLESAGAKTIFDTSKLPGAILDLLVAEPRLLVEERERLAAVVRATERAMDDWRNQPREIEAGMALHAGMDAAELAASFKGLKVPRNGEQAALLDESGPIGDSIRAAADVLGVPAPPRPWTDGSVAEQEATRGR